MLQIFYKNQKEQNKKIFHNMYKLRKKVFHNRLQWNVSIEENLEIDEFDDLNPLYVVYSDINKNVFGSFRLLQTTGPTMLRNVFPDCLPRGLDIRSPIVWESTRFCVDTELAQRRGSNGLSEVTGALLASLIEIGTLAGLSHIVTVIDVRMERILRRAGCPIERLADPVDYGGVQTLAILMECSEEWVGRIHAKNNILKAQIPFEYFNKLNAA